MSDSFTPYEPPPPPTEPASPPSLSGAPPPPASPSIEPPAPPKKKSRAGIFFLGAFSGCLLLFLGIFFLAFAFAASRDSGTSDFKLGGNKIAIVPIEGEIFESRETVEALNRYADNHSVKAIVVRLNSPGGAIAPSQEIYSEILKLRQRRGKPIVASMDSVAASGAYYIAAACDEIVANPGSITGSIGVILQWLSMEDLVKWAKMKPETITSGALKAAGSPYQELSEEERQYLHRVVLQLHSQFVRAVAAGRKGKLTEADVARLADGRIFTGEEAHALKLVDTLGNLDDAVRAAARRAGVRGEPTTIYPRRRTPTLLDLLTDNETKSAIEWVLNRKAARFLYRWQ
jgi:protease-4